MSEETQTEDEPSIEEILDSIRQIISEDDEGEGDDIAPEPEEEAVQESEPEEVVAAPEVEPETEEAMDQSAIDDMDFDAPAPDDPDPEADILELTELVNTEENQLDVDMQEGAEEEEEPEVEEVVEEPEPEIIEEPEPEIIEEPSPPPVDTVPDDSLLTDQAEAAAISAMSELVRKTAVESNGITLEDIVRFELKPLLRDWLDKHLPTVIERLVQEELERVSKRVLDE